MFRKIKDDFWMLRRSGRNILVFELTYKLAATAVFYPIAILIINLVMKAAGAKYLTNEYIIRIFKNPVSWIVMLAAVVIFVFYCIYEMSFLAACFELKRQQCKASVLEIAFTSLKRMKRLINIRNLPLIFFYFISILAINVTMLGSKVLFHSFPSSASTVFMAAESNLHCRSSRSIRANTSGKHSISS